MFYTDALGDIECNITETSKLLSFFHNLMQRHRCMYTGELNNVATKKMDLEAWFPGSFLRTFVMF